MGVLFFLFFFYSPILLHPSKYIFGDKDDCIKNYFSYQWHVQNDDSFINNSGTNYPYGEHHSFTDGNPLLSDFIKAIPFLKKYSIAIFNLSLLGSFILCALFLFKIFKEFGVSNYLGIIASVGITFLNPQSLRLLGHYTLVYCFFIPMLIYFLIKFEARENKSKYSIFISLIILLGFFIHPYLGMIGTSFVFLYHLIKLSVFRKNIKYLIGSLFVQVAVPFLLYFIFIKITDTHKDRISTPYGFLFYTSSIETVFVSTLPPFRHLLSQIIKIKGQTWEGIAYIGITSLFAFLYLPVLIIRKRKQLKLFFQKNDKTFLPLLIMGVAAAILLFFSMGYPFQWEKSWLDKFPLIKQFRSPGRFAWVFYFVSTISATIILSKYFLNLTKISARIIVGLLLSLFMVEGFAYHKHIASRTIYKNVFEFDNLDPELKEICKAIEKESPQAIIPLPFFHFGTDYFYFEGSQKIKTALFCIAYHTRTPIMAGCTSRTSLSEARSLVQLIASDLIKKEVEAIVDKNKTICIVYSKESLEEGELNLLGKGSLILETKNFIIKGIVPSELFELKQGASVRKFTEGKDTFIYSKGFYLSSASYFKFIDFDSLHGKKLSGNVNAECVLYDIQPNSLERDMKYEVSFWYDLKGKYELTEDLVIKEEIPGTNAFTLLNAKGCNKMPNIVKNKVLVVLNFKTGSPQNKIRICLKGNSEYNGDFSLDNLLIRKKDVDIYRKVLSGKDSILTVNNFELMPDQ